MRSLALLAAAVLMVALLAVPGGSSTEVSDTLSVVKDDQTGVTNAQITALIAAVTPTVGDAVMITRDDNFADALASGLLQRNGPLLAVPQNGPIPADVLAQIRAATPERAIILGGTGAVSAAVADELSGLNLDVSRLAGSSRFETAIAIAEAEAPDADIIMLARAFPSPGSTDPTQAFADTLAAGGVSARTGWPVLLTDTESLSAPTADYLARSGATRVMVLGGTAAISQAAFDAAVSIVGSGERVSGPTRFETAIELEKAAGVDSARDASQVILVEGTGTNAFTGATSFSQGGGAAGPAPWAAGYASANRAFVFNAPILLTASGVIPEPTAAFLADGVGGDPNIAPLITCMMTGPACQEGREAAGLAPAIPITINPPEGALTAGAAITVSFTGYAGSATATGSCLAATASTTDGSAITANAADRLPTDTCQVIVSGVMLADGSTQTETFDFTTPIPNAPRRPAAEVTSIDLGIGGICGLAVDESIDMIYAVGCNTDSLIHRFDLAGQPRSPASFPFSFGITNDVDLDIISTPTTILGQQVPAGSLLMIDGETVDGLLVIDPADGTVLVGPADPETGGTTVGVAWDPAADQIIELSWNTDTISRLNPTNLLASTTFPVMPPGSPDVFDVFFGDIEVGCDGDLFLVSSSDDAIMQLAGDGSAIRAFYDVDRTTDTTGENAAIALNEVTGQAYVAQNTTGTVVLVDGLDVGTC